MTGLYVPRLSFMQLEHRLGDYSSLQYRFAFPTSVPISYFIISPIWTFLLYFLPRSGVGDISQWRSFDPSLVAGGIDWSSGHSIHRARVERWTRETWGTRNGVICKGCDVISASTFGIHSRVYSLPVVDWSHASGQTEIQQRLDPFEQDERLLMVSLRKRLISTLLHIRCLVCRHPSFTQSAVLDGFAYTLPWWHSMNTNIPVSLSLYWPLFKVWYSFLFQVIVGGQVRLFRTSWMLSYVSVIRRDQSDSKNEAQYSDQE